MMNIYGLLQMLQQQAPRQMNGMGLMGNFNPMQPMLGLSGAQRWAPPPSAFQGVGNTANGVPQNYWQGNRMVIPQVQGQPRPIRPVAPAPQAPAPVQEQMQPTPGGWGWGLQM